MLDIKFIRDNPEAVKENIKKKFQEEKIPLVDQVIELDRRNRDAMTEANSLRAARNTLSKQVGMLMGQAKKDPSKLEEAEAAKAQVKANADRLAELEKRESELEDEIHKLMMVIPNIIDPSVPIGPDDSANVELERFGEPVIPEFIVVHDGRPDDVSAQNYWVRFKDYVKNVACSEIYSTWRTEAIKANVLAIVSFTLNRVYTEWYRGKGYDFTITSSTAFDQSYSHGRTIFEEIGVVVDDLFTTYVTKEGISQPLFTQYCDGRRTQCQGLSQWGSQALGEQGWDAVSILRKYYGSEVYLKSAEKVEGVPLSYDGEVLTLGSEGEAVRTIQNQLNRIADNFPAIPKIPADGVYGPATQAAVTEFQKIFHLPQTGSVDFAVWYEISNVYVAVAELA